MDIIYKDVKQAYVFDDLIQLERTINQTTEALHNQFDKRPFEYILTQAEIRNNNLTLLIYLRRWENKGSAGSGWTCDNKIRPQLIGIIDTFAEKVNAENVEYESIDAKESYIEVTMDIYD